MNNGIAQITLSGKPVFLKFGLPALRRMQEMAAKFDIITGERYNDLGFAHILYAGYINECARHEMLPQLPFNLFYDYVDGADEQTADEIFQAINAWDESKAVQEFAKKEKKSLTTITTENENLSIGE